MLYAITLTDAPDSDSPRKEHHAGHIAHFGANKAKIALAGPLSDDNGESVGSLVVFEAESAEDAQAFIEGDPFYDAGVWQNVMVAKLKASIFDAAKFG